MSSIIDNKKWKKFPGGYSNICFSITLMLMIIITSFPQWNNVSGDGGFIPFHDLSVYEPGQKAIIAWDGETEIMVLSVDMYSEFETKVLHMVPFPDEPEVEMGNISIFEEVENV